MEATARPASRLSVSQVLGRSVVVAARAHSPLRLLTPRNHGHAAWAYQSSYGGGMVGADDVALELEVGAGSTLFLGSQASTKIFRAARSRFALDARVGAGGALVSWPDPVACFPGASFRQRQSFALERDASLLCVDAFSAGRVARGERWAFEHLHARLELTVGGALAFRDALRLDPAHGPLDARLDGMEAIATVLLAGPKLACAELRDAVDARPLAHAPLTSASPQPWGLVLRCAARSTEALQRHLRELLTPHIHALLGDDPWARKW